MPSRRHELLAWALPRIRGAADLDTVDAERARIERWHADLDRTVPTRVVPLFDRRFTLTREELTSPGAEAFPAYTLARRGRVPTRTVLYLHGGGFVAPLDPFHVRYAARLARELDARVVLPDYPLAPEHTWRDSHDTLVDLAVRLAGDPGGLVLAGDSAGGGLALAVALGLGARSAGPHRGPPPTHLLLHAPWADLTESTPATETVSADDPWLSLGKLRAYAAWWAGSADDLGRPEVSPALAPSEQLAALPPTLMLCGTRDTLLPGCRLLADRAAQGRSTGGWPLTYVEEPGLLHVYALFPGVPEAARAWRRTRAFLGGPSPC